MSTSSCPRETCHSRLYFDRADKLTLHSIQLDTVRPLGQIIQRNAAKPGFSLAERDADADVSATPTSTAGAHVATWALAKGTPTPTGLTGIKHCNEVITIECLRALYGFPAGTTAQAGNEMGIGEWSDYLYQPDLEVFFKNYTKPQIPQGTFPEFISIDGGRRATKHDAETEHVIESVSCLYSGILIVASNVR